MNAAGCSAACWDLPEPCEHDDHASAGDCVVCQEPVAFWLLDAGRAERLANGDVSHKPGLCPEDEEG